jgi:hypothetical protein
MNLEPDEGVEFCEEVELWDVRHQLKHLINLRSSCEFDVEEQRLYQELCELERLLLVS